MAARRSGSLLLLAALPFAHPLALPTRRALLRAAALTVAAPLAPAVAEDELIDVTRRASSNPDPACSGRDGVNVRRNSNMAQVYFGCGCFWHVQHEFVEAERSILGRKDAELTSLAGYAGGNAGLKNGKVCYHNAAMMSDYGSLGHAEVVGMRIPTSSFGAFAEEYCKLFDSKGNRPDQSGDRGPECVDRARRCAHGATAASTLPRTPLRSSRTPPPRR
jgi:hypothetical protein